MFISCYCYLITYFIFEFFVGLKKIEYVTFVPIDNTTVDMSAIFAYIF